MEILGLPDLAHDDMLQKTWYRMQHKDQFAERVHDTLQHWTRQDLFDRLSEQHVIAGPVLSMAELGQNPQLQARNYFTTPNPNHSQAITYPGAPAKLSATPWKLRRGLASIGEHQAVLSSPPSLPAMQRTASEPKQTGPLAGYRGIVLTQAWAGTYATELLAFMGAEVIQLAELFNLIESTH